MRARLLVNADDAGLADFIDEGIRHAVDEGIVRSVSVLATGRTFAAAAAWLREGRVGVGVHLALTGGLPAASPPGEVPSLLERGRLRRSWPGFVAALLGGRVRLAEVEQELDAQVRRALDAGLTIDHVDGHQHLHVLPGALERVVRVCERHGIRAMRLPLDPGTGPARLAGEAKRLVVAALAWRARDRLPPWLRTPDSCLGVAASGRLDRRTLLRILDRLPPGTSELMCHPGARSGMVPEDPGWVSAWEAELRALTDPRLPRELADRGIKLSRFADL